MNDEKISVVNTRIDYLEDFIYGVINALRSEYKNLYRIMTTLQLQTTLQKKGDKKK